MYQTEPDTLWIKFSSVHSEPDTLWIKFSSVRSVVSNSLPPYEPQHSRPPCPSPTPGFYPNPCPLSQWCHPAISSSVVPFSSCPQSLPASVFFNESTLRMRWPKYWSFSFNIIPSKEHPGLISFSIVTYGFEKAELGNDAQDKVSFQ